MTQKGQTGILVLAGIVILVAVAGGIFYFGRATAPKPQPSPTPQPAPTSDETANWKTYTNEKFIYLIKYPSEATYIEEFSKDLAHIATFKINGGLLKIIVNLDPRFGEFNESNMYKINRNFVVAGIQAKKIYDTQTTGIVSYIPSPNRRDGIHFDFTLPKDPKEAEEVDKLFDKMLSTFHFIGTN